MIEWVTSGFHYVWSFVVILSVIVFVHEFGHYIVARWCGVKVDVFSIGFGREIWGYTAKKSGTRWKLSLLPFGGYVKMFGDASAASTPDINAFDQMSEQEKTLSFHHKPLWAKSLVVAAGPLANFILAITIFTYFIFTSGISSTEPKVGELIKGLPAAIAGLKVGDEITQVNGKKVKVFNDIPAIVTLNVGEPIIINFIREGKPLQLSMIPKFIEDKDALGNVVKRPVIGFKSPTITFKKVGLPRALKEAVLSTYNLCASSMQVLGQMLSGKRSAEELKGPVGIAKLSGQVTQSGDTLSQTLHTILWFIALLSVNLGMVNLFPIPMLDGGHLVYYAIEALRGKPMAERYMNWGYKFGFILLASLMAFTLFNDLRQMLGL